MATHGKILLVLLPVRFSLLVELEPILAFLPVVSIGVKLDRLLLPFNRLVEIAHFGIGGGESSQHIGILPLSQSASTGGKLDSPFAVPEAFLGTSRPQPCQSVVSRGKGAIEPDGFFVICDRHVVVLPDPPGVTPVVVGECEARIEPDSLVEVGDGLVVVLLVVPGTASVVVG